MKIKLAGIVVSDQQKAHDFYTNVLGFVVKNDIPMGEFRWLTVVTKDNDDIELSLEPNENPISKTFQQGLKEQRIPATAFAVDDMQSEYQRLLDLGVEFTGEPKDAGGTLVAMFDDTCGNFIQLYQI